MLIRPNDPYHSRKREPIDWHWPTLMETVEVFVGFFVMLGQVLVGMLTCAVGFFMFVVSGGLLAVVIGGIVLILIVLFS